MQKKHKDIWKYVVGKVSKSYGETDLDKHIIKINKAYHKSKGDHKAGIRKNKDGTANITDTLLHETLHSKHPKMLEKNIRKLTRKKFKKLGRKGKKKLLDKIDK